MFKRALGIALTLGASSCLNPIYAQVGIGTTDPDASAMLDIQSSNSGFLMPRVSLAGTDDISTISSPATGLMVYNTESVSDVTPGFYFYDGSDWERLNSTSEEFKSYGEIYSSANQVLSTGINTVILNEINASQGVTVTGNSFSITTSGTYRLVYCASVSHSSDGNSSSGSEVGFYLTTSSGPIAGSHSYLMLERGNINKGSVSMSKIMHLDAGETLSLGANAGNGYISIIGSSAVLSVEYINAN